MVVRMITPHEMISFAHFLCLHEPGELTLIRDKKLEASLPVTLIRSRCRVMCKSHVSHVSHVNRTCNIHVTVSLSASPAETWGEQIEFYPGMPASFSDPGSHNVI